MGKITHFITLTLILNFLVISNHVLAQTAEENLADGYISDELFIYMHSGPGNNYRILGTINAGTLVKLTGEESNEYTQIIDDKERTTWVESKFVSTKPGLRFIVAELNGQLAANAEQSDNLTGELSDLRSKLEQAQSDNSSLNNQLAEINKQLSVTQSKLKSQDMDMKKEWFFNGAIVLGLGLILGLVIPRLSMRKKSSMESWK